MFRAIETVILLGCGSTSARWLLYLAAVLTELEARALRLLVGDLESVSWFGKFTEVDVAESDARDELEAERGAPSRYLPSLANVRGLKVRH